MEAAYYINDRGQISGDAFLDDGHERVYLLTPCGENDPDGCQSDMFVANTAADAASAIAMKVAPTGDEHVSNFSDLLRQLEQRRHGPIRPPAQSH